MIKHSKVSSQPDSDNPDLVNASDWNDAHDLSDMEIDDVPGLTAALAAKAPAALAWNTQTASYTLALSDAIKGVIMEVASANNVTVPPNSSVAFPVGTSIPIVQKGAGITTIVAGAGVTLRLRSPLTLAMAGDWAVASVAKIATDEWVVTGDLT